MSKRSFNLFASDSSSSSSSSPAAKRLRLLSQTGTKPFANITFAYIGQLFKDKHNLRTRIERLGGKVERYVTDETHWAVLDGYTWKHHQNLIFRYKVKTVEAKELDEVLRRLEKQTEERVVDEEVGDCVIDLTRDGSPQTEEETETGPSIASKSFTITGTFRGQEECKQRIKKLSYRVRFFMGHNTDFAVVGNEPDDEDMQLIRSLGLKTLDPDALRRMLFCAERAKAVVVNITEGEDEGVGSSFFDPIAVNREDGEGENQLEDDGVEGSTLTTASGSGSFGRYEAGSVVNPLIVEPEGIDLEQDVWPLTSSYDEAISLDADDKAIVISLESEDDDEAISLDADDDASVLPLDFDNDGDIDDDADPTEIVCLLETPEPSPSRQVSETRTAEEGPSESDNDDTDNDDTASDDTASDDTDIDIEDEAEPDETHQLLASVSTSPSPSPPPEVSETRTAVAEETCRSSLAPSLNAEAAQEVENDRLEGKTPTDEIEQPNEAEKRLRKGSWISRWQSIFLQGQNISMLRKMKASATSISGAQHMEKDEQGMPSSSSGASILNKTVNGGQMSASSSMGAYRGFRPSILSPYLRQLQERTARAQSPQIPEMNTAVDQELAERESSVETTASEGRWRFLEESAARLSTPVPETNATVNQEPAERESSTEPTDDRGRRKRSKTKETPEQKKTRLEDVKRYILYQTPPNSKQNMQNFVDRITGRLLPPNNDPADCHFYSGAKEISEIGHARISSRVGFKYQGRKRGLTLQFGTMALLLQDRLTDELKEAYINNGHLSHLCGNWSCCNLNHLTIEPGPVNFSRNKCFPKHGELCVHQPPCMRDKKLYNSELVPMRASPSKRKLIEPGLEPNLEPDPEPDIDPDEDADPWLAAAEEESRKTPTPNSSQDSGYSSLWDIAMRQLNKS
ncbi:hypothetical protein K402DRAFT_456338 [Aulographum hederae CBS 113979]|uniref:BRCT domain-containing protein n=1 Tax=Aulographum hederae CBS 113979 TaxID=1176131 RepID=A0A6G1GST8_9PEZI|nr:hypothetical protein K402DRAFT_456338 [Aulographum hederae CBS 113979]